MEDRTIAKRLTAIFRALLKAYGPQHWWPGDTAFEVMVGAVLTQNAAWSNVEKAIANIRDRGLLAPSRLAAVPRRRLAALIRPSGYFNVKAQRLHNLVAFLMDHHQGSVKRMFRRDPVVLRQELLAVNGIGPETADSILLYAGNKPLFVVDAYTKRVFSRHGIVSSDASYDQVQRLFMGGLPRDARLYNEYHALIVRLGKERCKKSRPRCEGCPLEAHLP
jgi:endonuclease-3 related protein